MNGTLQHVAVATVMFTACLDRYKQKYLSFHIATLRELGFASVCLKIVEMCIVAPVASCNQAGIFVVYRKRSHVFA